MKHDLPALADRIGRERVAYVDDACLLICARWQDVLGELPTVDAMITDPPYSERTHAAQISAPRDPVAAAHGFEALEYDGWSPNDATRAAESWHAATGGWCVVFSDHSLQRSYEEAFERAGRYVFAPLPQVTVGRSVRLCGDGPATWSTWITVARPRSLRAWGALPGAYVDSVGARQPGVVRGAKQLPLMRALVRDYSREHDLVLDPCAGGATTLLAARLEGRQCIGIEMDPQTCELAAHRLRPYAGRRRDGQLGLFGAGE